MVKKEPNTGKKVEESLDLDTSRDSPVSREYPIPSKTSVSSGGNVKSLGGRPVQPGEDDGKAGSSLEGKLRTPVSVKLRNQNIRAAPNLRPTLLPASRRKSRQQLQKETAAAVTIQSAWRGHQVRREIGKMAKAATKIQTTFRGHKIRKELPLSFCDHGRSKSKKKIHARKESMSVSELQSCFQQLGFIGTHAKSQSILPYYPKPRNCLTFMGDSTLLRPEVTFLQIETGHRSSMEMFTCSSLSVLATEIDWQRYHNAAIIIQAAWRGYQVRKTIAAQTENSHSKSFSFKYVCEEILRKGTISKHPSKFRACPDTVLLGFVPRIRSINLYTVVKGAPASKKPNVSMRVLSPNAVIQGFQREKSTGLQGLYTVKSSGALWPTQLFVRVDMRKELKTLSSYLAEKDPKPGKGQTKGAAV